MTAPIDPARAVKRTGTEWRKLFQASCRDSPCSNVRALLAGKSKKLPNCIVCVHEGAVQRKLT